MYRLWWLSCCLGWTGCIADRVSRADPERADAAVDAHVDAQLPDQDVDAQLPDAAPPCVAEPTCPPDQVPVDACPPDTPCTRVTACGVQLLCASACVCPEGWLEADRCAPDDPHCIEIDGCELHCIDAAACVAGPTCADGEVVVDRCAPDEDACRVQTECGETYGCMPTACCDRPPECPPRTQLDPTCTENDPACTLVEGCAQPRWCRTQSTCPEHTRSVEACLLDDPLCWVLFDGQACVSEACPLDNPCMPQEVRVDACPPDRICTRRNRCNEPVLCLPPAEPEPSNCAANGCAEGWRSVVGCRPGRACVRDALPGCNLERYCEQCASPDCSETIEPGGCPPFMQPIASCPPGRRTPGCVILSNGQACGTNAPCPPGESCQVHDCEEPPDEGAEPPDEGDGLPDPECLPGTRPVSYCSPNGRACIRISSCGFSVLCEACSPCDAECLPED